jgi:hypothetical protein
MKSSLIKVWRRHVNDTYCGIKPLVESIEDFENSCRFAVGAYCLFLQGIHFPSMRLLQIIDLKIDISLKNLDYRVTSP